MKRLIVIWVVLTVVAVPAWPQKIEVEKPDSSRIVQVRTALNHLTVIEVGEPVMTVAAGSPAFKIEWRDNKVFIQPTEPNVATNLFIWTASGRLNYELEPAGAVGQMDFAIDNPPPLARVTATKSLPAPPPLGASTDPLLGGKPIRMEGFKEPRNRVVVLLKDVFQNQDHEIFIRYAVQNNSKEAYRVRTPEVFALKVSSPPRPRDQSSNLQLTDADASQIDSEGEAAVTVVDGTVRASSVAPGQETVGVVGIKLPVERSGPTVLRLVFPSDGKSQPAATLVL